MWHGQAGCMCEPHYAKGAGESEPGGQEMLSNETWTAVLAQGFLEEPCRWIMSGLASSREQRPAQLVALAVFFSPFIRGATYLLLQVVVAVRFMDCREGMECLPLTCCPMFAVPRNVFQDELRGGATCSDNRDSVPAVAVGNKSGGCALGAYRC